MKYFVSALFLCFTLIAFCQAPQSTPKSRKAISENEAPLTQALSEKGMKLGDPIFIRIFKESSELEIWVKAENQSQYELFKTYEICYFSGDLGPKTSQGDGQSPEGFYFINADRFNPWSSYHLSLNMGYPNAYDQSKNYTGNYLMIHGSCVSVGCYAMTDDGIEKSTL